MSERKGRPHISFPMTKQMKPTVYLRGALKQQVYDAVWDAYCTERTVRAATEENECNGT